MTEAGFSGTLPFRRRVSPRFHPSRGIHRSVSGQNARFHGVFSGFPPALSLDLSYHPADILISTVMYSNKLSFFLVFFLIVLVFSGVPEEKTMLLGGPAGWTAFSREQNLARVRGRLGYEAVVLD